MPKLVVVITERVYVERSMALIDAFAPQLTITNLLLAASYVNPFGVLVVFATTIELVGAARSATFNS